MGKNKLVFITGMTSFGPVTRAYLNVKKEGALVRFRTTYPSMTDSQITEIDFDDTIQINQRLTPNDIVSID